MSKFELPLQKKVSEDQQIQRNFNSQFPHLQNRPIEKDQHFKNSKLKLKIGKL